MTLCTHAGMACEFVEGWTEAFKFAVLDSRYLFTELKVA